MKLIITLSLLFISHSIFSIDFEDAIFPEIATSSRALSIGNAYISGVNDPLAAFYNPAGLGSINTKKKLTFRISSLHLEANGGWLSTATGGNFFSVPGKIIESLSLDGMRKLLLENKGKMSHLRFQTLPNFTIRYFTIGYLYSLRQRATIGTESNSPYEYAYRKDHGPYIGFNISLFGGIFKLGATGIYLNRKEVIGNSAQELTIELQNSDYKKGQALIIIGGTKITFPTRGLPTFSITSHNLQEKSFSNFDGGVAPNKIKNSLDLGLSLTPRISNLIRLHFEVNYKDFSEKFSDIAIQRKILAGIEINYAHFFFLRLGYGDGFGSFGIGVRGKKVDFDLTSYAVDSTDKEFRGREDRRIVISFSSGI